MRAAVFTGLKSEIIWLSYCVGVPKVKEPCSYCAKTQKKCNFNLINYYTYTALEKLALGSTFNNYFYEASFAILLKDKVSINAQKHEIVWYISNRFRFSCSLSTFSSALFVKETNPLIYLFCWKYVEIWKKLIE